MTKRAASGIALTLCACLFAGCGTGASADASDDNPTVTTPSTAPATTTTTVPPPYSFDGSVPPPELINTGTDYETIYRSLSSYATWLLAHNPDPNLASETYIVGTPVYDRFQSDATLLGTGNARLFEVEEPLEIETVSTLTSAASLRVTERVATQRLVDQDGTTIQERSFQEPFEWVVLLQANPSGRWRIASVDPLTS